MIYGDGCVYIPVEKCATHSMRDVLQNAYGWRLLFGDGQPFPNVDLPVEWLLKRYPHIAPFVSVLAGMKGDAADVFTFAVCRNPYDRMVSTWFDVTQKVARFNAEILAEVGGIDFPVFVDWATSRIIPDSATSRRSLYQTQSARIGKFRIDKLLRFERLNQDFAELPFARPDKLPPHLNRTSHDRRHWSTYYDDTTAAKVREWAAADFDAFGYSADIDERDAA